MRHQKELSNKTPCSNTVSRAGSEDGSLANNFGEAGDRTVTAPITLYAFISESIHHICSLLCSPSGFIKVNESVVPK